MLSTQRASTVLENAAVRLTVFRSTASASSSKERLGHFGGRTPPRPRGGSIAERVHDRRGRLVDARRHDDDVAKGIG